MVWKQEPKSWMTSDQWNQVVEENKMTPEQLKELKTKTEFNQIQQIANLKQENARLAAEVEQAKEKLLEARADCGDLRERLSNAENKNRSLASEVEKLRSERDGVVEQLEKVKEYSSSELHEIRDELKKLRTEIERLQMKIDFNGNARRPLGGEK